MNAINTRTLNKSKWLIASFIMLLATTLTINSLANRSEKATTEVSTSKNPITGEWKMTYSTDDMPTYFKFDENGLFYKTKELHENALKSELEEQFNKGIQGVYSLKESALELNFVNQANEIILPKAHGFNTISFTTKWFSDNEFRVFKVLDTPKGSEIFETVFSRISQD